MPDTPITSDGELFFPAGEGPFFDWTPTVAPGSGADVVCAELSRLAYATLPRIELELRRIGFDVLAILESRRLFSSRAAADGFVCRDPRSGTRFAVFRGTETGNVDDLLANLLVDPVEWRPGIVVHRGWGLTFDELRAPLERVLQAPSVRTIATGHSLGGALATLCATDFRGIELVSFGAPRVGSGAFPPHAAHAVRRYVHCCDLVPRVPPARFDEADLGEIADGLLDNLAAPAGWLSAASQAALRQSARLAAGAMARIARGRGWEHAFAHPGGLVYLDRNGGIHHDPVPELVVDDQRLARREYREALGSGRPETDEGAILEALGSLSAALLRADAAAVRSARERLVAELVRSDSLGRVVVRDLADHAVIHYVRALLDAPRGGPPAFTRTPRPPPPAPGRT